MQSRHASSMAETADHLSEKASLVTTDHHPVMSNYASVVENLSKDAVPEKLLSSYVSTGAQSKIDGNKNQNFGLDDFTKRRQTAEKILIYQTYRWLMVMAAMLVCLAHGSNDVANAIAPLIVVSTVYDRNERVPFFLGATGISIGLICLGYKVMETVGKKVVKLDFVKGFCAQFSTAICVICGSILKIPLSTTHCMVGALFGIIIANKLSFVQRAYGVDQSGNDCDDDENSGKRSDSAIAKSQDDLDSQDSEEEVSDETKKANKKVVFKILMWWVATLPVALGVSAALTYLCLINAPTKV